MKRWFELSAGGARTLFSWFVSFAVWTLWLGLVLLLVVQLYVLSANELALPGFVVRQLEARLAESGVRASFGRTSFDPAGRVLIENVRLTLPAFNEPILTARSVYVRLNPLPLLVGSLEPRELRLTDVAAVVPAILSPTGRPEDIIRDLDATLEPRRRAVEIRQLSARIAGVNVSARGTVMLAPSRERKPALDTFAQFLAQRFPALCRQALTLTERVAELDEPALDLEFSPSESGAPTIQVVALARGAKLAQPVAAEGRDLRATTRLLLFGDEPPSDIEFAASVLHLPGNSVAQDVHARILGRLRTERFHFDLREVTATADAVHAGGVDARAIAARVFPRRLPELEGRIVADVLGAPLTLRAESDLAARKGIVRFEGAISPRTLDLIGRKVGTDVRRFFDFDGLTAERGEARFGPDWTFEKLTARVHIPRLVSYGIPMQDGRATIELDPDRLHSPDAFARLGENFARGSYEHDLRTNHYRFLLVGRLRPLDISGWFRGGWWSNFFRQLEFPSVAPEASVDVRGSWRDGRQSNVFVFADASSPIVRGTPLDRVRTRLFLRPAFYDGLEVFATRGSGVARGRFTSRGDPTTLAWHALDFAIDSTLDLPVAKQLLGPSIAATLDPFRLATAPTVKLRGEIAGAAAPEGAREKLQIEAHTVGEFRYNGFPLQNVSFTAALDRDDVVLDRVEAQFAGGSARGRARITGAGEQRRLGFDVSLDDASLGQVAANLGDFLAAQKGQPPAPPGKFVQEKANVRLNLAVSAEGRYANPLSYSGGGTAVLRGAEIGEVPLLGTLSEFLKFTALRFTEARSHFRIEGAKLVFPNVALRGANSAIDAHGSYALDRRELDFNAKIFPFQESDSLLKSVVGAVLTPLSNAFEVKLSGSLEKPEWVFVMGPTNFIRTLAPGEKRGGDAGTPSAPSPPESPSKSAK